MSWTGGWELLAPYPGAMSGTADILYAGPSKLWASTYNDVWTLDLDTLQWELVYDALGFDAFFMQADSLYGVRDVGDEIRVYKTADGSSWELRATYEELDRGLTVLLAADPGWIFIEIDWPYAGSRSYAMCRYKDDPDYSGPTIFLVSGTQYYDDSDIAAYAFPSQDGIYKVQKLYNRDPVLYHWAGRRFWPVAKPGTPTWKGASSAAQQAWQDGSSSYVAGSPGFSYDTVAREWQRIANPPRGESLQGHAAEGGYVAGTTGVLKYDPAGDYSLVLPTEDQNENVINLSEDVIYFNDFCWNFIGYSGGPYTHLWEDDSSWVEVASCEECEEQHM